MARCRRPIPTCFGYVASIGEAAPSWRADAGPAVVLGAGGAARAILIGLIEKGAKDIRLTNRTAQRAEELAREFGSVIRTVPWSARADALAGAAMLINTTSQGMVGQPPLDIDLEKLPKSALVSDAVYVPLETPLLGRGAGTRQPHGGRIGDAAASSPAGLSAWFGIMPQVTPRLRAEIEATIR